MWSMSAAFICFVRKLFLYGGWDGVNIICVQWKFLWVEYGGRIQNESLIHFVWNEKRIEIV